MCSGQGDESQRSISHSSVLSDELDELPAGVLGKGVVVSACHQRPPSW